MKPLRIAVIVTTYNRPPALAAVLDSLAGQSYGDFEVLVADDGSGPETAQLIEERAARVEFPLHHVWHQDQGFRAAAIRNRAVAQTRAPYLVFLDGDCLVRPDFLRWHARLASSGRFVAGNRVLLSEPFTEGVLKHGLPLPGWGKLRLLAARLRGDINRFWPLVRLPLEPLRDRTPQRWEGVKTCNLGLWRADFLAVNGLDERYQGWGYEDSDLAIRLIRNAVDHRDGRFATTVLHLWHPERRHLSTPENLERLQAVEQGTEVRAEQGVDRHLS